jgi:hypothetical protein
MNLLGVLRLCGVTTFASTFDEPCLLDLLSNTVNRVETHAFIDLAVAAVSCSKLGEQPAQRGALKGVGVAADELDSGMPSVAVGL